MAGHLDSIFTAPTAKAALVRCEQVLAIPDVGLEGDRYAIGCGSFSRWPGAGRQVSLIAAEAIDDVVAETGIDLRDGRSRRNLVTRDVRLTDLIGKIFRIGDAVFRGDRECTPCAFLERLTEPGAFAALKGRGGLRADVIAGGLLRVGDSVMLEPIQAKSGPPIGDRPHPSATPSS